MLIANQSQPTMLYYSHFHILNFQLVIQGNSSHDSIVLNNEIYHGKFVICNYAYKLQIKLKWFSANTNSICAVTYRLTHLH